MDSIERDNAREEREHQDKVNAAAYSHEKEMRKRDFYSNLYHVTFVACVRFVFWAGIIIFIANNIRPLISMVVK